MTDKRRAASAMLSFAMTLPFLSACSHPVQDSRAAAADARPEAAFPAIFQGETTMPLAINDLLAEIYASRVPVRFEQIDVSDIANRHIPQGTPRSAIVDAFRTISSAQIIQDAQGKLTIRDNKGKAMLDPDARSVVLMFSFDDRDTLIRTQAFHLKNQ